MNERNRSTKSTSVRYVDWTTDSGSATRRRGGVPAPAAAGRPRRLKLKVRLRATGVQRLRETGPSTVVDDGTAGGSTHADVTSAVELPLLSRILILLRSPAKLVQLLLLVIAATCFERSLSNVDEFLLSDSCYYTSSTVTNQTPFVQTHLRHNPLFTAISRSVRVTIPPSGSDKVIHTGSCYSNKFPAVFVLWRQKGGLLPISK